MFGQGGKAGDLLRPASDHLHGSGQEVIKLPDVLSIISRWTSWTLLELQKVTSGVRHQKLHPYFVQMFEQQTALLWSSQVEKVEGLTPHVP